MNEIDEYDRLIANRLPCDCGDRDGRGGHFSSCAAYWRDEVAELLREQGAEIAKLKEQLATSQAKSNAAVAELISQRNQLLAQLAEAEQLGMEKAITIAQEYIRTHSYPSGGEIRDAIRAAMPKAGEVKRCPYCLQHECECSDDDVDTDLGAK